MPKEGYYLPHRDMVSQAQQSMIERPDIPRSKFSTTWSALKTFDAGYLVPFLVDEVLPGDHMSYDVTAYVRMATPLFPIFSNQKVETFFFFVPCRLLWSNWKGFMGEQPSPSSSINFTIPVVATIQGAGQFFDPNTLYDHFGIPTKGMLSVGGSFSVNALPLRAYNLIWNEWFRDENLQNPATQNTGNGADPIGDYVTRRRAKQHDFFTSCLPWPQKFTPPALPLAGFARVAGLGYDFTSAASQNQNINVVEASNVPGTPPAVGQTYAWAWPLATAPALWMKGLTGVAGTDMPQVYADLSSATGTTINVLRQAWLVQQLLERDARGGTRYTELVRSHFGVVSPDARQQRPEYMGGGSHPLMVTPVAQTAPSTGVTVGALGAAATSVGKHTASYASTEHGYIIGLINVQTELLYQQSWHPLWARRLRYDFYWPSLAGLGEQAVLNATLYQDGSSAGNNVFGYQERWQEYRTRWSEVTGKFRSYETGTLDAWHLAENFGSMPTLGDTFIQSAPPMSRVLAAGSAANTQQYLADIQIKRDAVRPLPMFGTPVALGRF